VARSEEPTPTQPLVHLALVAEWEEAVAAGGPYRRSTIGRSLEEEGFVHGAFARQVPGVVERYYRGREDDLVVLVLDPARLDAELRVEDLLGSGEAFPHVYGPIPLEAVRSATPLRAWLAPSDPDEVEIETVVFDIGGVLLDWQPRLLYDQLLDDPAELDWFLAEVCTHEWNLTLDAGRSFDEACGELAARHPDHAHLVHAWRRQDEMIAGEVAGVVDLVDALEAADVPRFLLTNMPADVFATRLERYEVLRRFHGAVVSGEEGVLKPSREIFEILLTRFDLDPGTTLFIDDAEVNVAGARAAGLHAHHFTDAARLAAELRSRRLID